MQQKAVLLLGPWLALRYLKDITYDSHVHNLKMWDWWIIKASTVLVALYCTARLFKVILKKTMFAPYYSITEYKENVVYVFEFPRKWTRQMLNLSPFAIKLESWLRLKKVDYQVRFFFFSFVRSSDHCFAISIAWQLFVLN